MFKLLKQKYLKHTSIYQFYRYYKYKYKFYPSFGATGEDVLINKIFRNMENGFYVDVGALHPINGSLTYNLYKKGWSGVNIDMLNENLKFFNYFRKRDTNLNAAISSSSGFTKAFIFETGSGLNTLNKKWADYWSKKINKPFLTQKIKKTTLNEVLNNNNVKKNFDFLNIDVEGHEVDVLKGINFKKYRPKLIAIEIHTKNTKEIFQTQTYKILKKNLYELISHYYQTSFFKCKNFDI